MKDEGGRRKQEEGRTRNEEPRTSGELRVAGAGVISDIRLQIAGLKLPNVPSLNHWDLVLVWDLVLEI